MSVDGLWEGRINPTISFEFFPARDENAAGKLDDVIDTLGNLNPDFCSVTFGAGGSTRKGSLDLVKKLKTEKQLKVVPYLATYGLATDSITEVVDKYRDINVDGLFCVRGDKPDNTESFSVDPNALSHATDLIDFISPRYDLFLGVAGYPEGHKEAESIEKDLDYLKLKIDKGAGFIITQYVYDNDMFYRFLDSCRNLGIDAPIVAGVMPVYGIKMTESLAAMCGAAIVPELRRKLDSLPVDDKKAVAQFGRNFALNQCRELISHGADGIHFYTMDRAKTVAYVISALREEGLL